MNHVTGCVDPNHSFRADGRGMIVTALKCAPRSEEVGHGKSTETIALRDVARAIPAGSRWPMTLRQLYHALVWAGGIGKTESANASFKRLCPDRREDGS